MAAWSSLAPRIEAKGVEMGEGKERGVGGGEKKGRRSERERG